jgi:Uma2 family endonuclease
MTMLICDEIAEQEIQQAILEQRRASGGDRFDEVWDGVYVMSPLANNEHQHLGTRLASIYVFVTGWDEDCRVCAGCNVSDREDDWRLNYRVPDAAVFLPGTKARDKKTYWLGGPDKAVEIMSPGDRTREKLPFYEKIGTRELLLVDRDPWALELYRLRGKKLKLVGRCTLDAPKVLESRVLPLNYTLVKGKRRPRIQVTHRETGQQWLV